MVRRRVGVRKITRVSHYTLNLLHVVLNTHPGLENRETWSTRITRIGRGKTWGTYLVSAMMRHRGTCNFSSWNIT